MASIKKLVLIACLALGLVLLTSAVALAGGTQIPHGGYSTTTDACLQCHDVHEASGDYVLLRWNTVTNTCGSCHFLYLSTPQLEWTLRSPANPLIGTYNDSATAGSVPAYNPGYSGNETDPAGYAPFGGVSGVNSIGSRTSAFEVPKTDALVAPGHNLSRGPGDWLYNDGSEPHQADYIPGGSNPLTAIKKGQYPLSVSALSYGSTAGLYCASCHTPHGNFGQQLLNASGDLVSSKLLSGRPNHTNSPPLSIENWGTQGGQWCLRCHDKRDGASVVYHNHPSSACLSCHGNYIGALAYANYSTATANSDFPHTGNAYNILSNVPDALCITCHVAGSLP